MSRSRAEIIALVEAAARAGDDARLDELFNAYAWLDDLVADFMFGPPAPGAVDLDDCPDDPLSVAFAQAMSLDAFARAFSRALDLWTARAHAEELRLQALDLARWQLSLQRLRELPAAAAKPVDSRPVTDRESRKTPGGRGRNLPSHRSTGPPARRPISWQVPMPP